MKLIDRSPGAFLALAFLVVYSVIGIEAAMWAIATPLAAFGTLALIAGVAAVIARSFEDLLGPDDVADRVAAPAKPARTTTLAHLTPTTTR